MGRFRSILFVICLLLPVAFFLAAGTAALWRAGWLAATWWIAPVLWGVAWLLARSAGAGAAFRSPVPLRELHWTPRDLEAVRIVEAYQRRVADVPAEQLVDPRFYVETARELAEEVARHYHPKVADPFARVTVREVVAAATLALEDLDRRIDEYVPGSHFVTIGQWRMLARSPAWFRRGRGLLWAATSVVRPASALRYLGAHATTQPLARRFKQNAFAAFWEFFVGEVGYFAIEMNSGRLRGGTDRYRSALHELKRDAPASERAPLQRLRRAASRGLRIEVPEEGRRVTLALVGRLGAGKSSVIRALLPEGETTSDRFPGTRRVRRYELGLAGSHERLAVLDAPGFASSAGQAALKETRAACLAADVILLVLDARETELGAERELVGAIDGWFAARPRQRMPPLVGVLTHVDLLEPEGDASPPYDLDEPRRPVELAIARRIDEARDALEDRLVAAVPVRVGGSGEPWGVEEGLIPVVTALLDEARAGAMLRTLHADLDAGKARRLLRQLRRAGSAIVRKIV